MRLRKRVLTSLWIVMAVLVFCLPLTGSTDQKININQAGMEELATLEKVGEKYAQRIVEYREANGPFEKTEDIMKVKGVGQKTWEANKDRIVVE